MIDLIRDQKPWTKNQIRKRCDAFLAKAETHADRHFLDSVNAAETFSGRTPSEGEVAFREAAYQRSEKAYEMAATAYAQNQKLAALCELQTQLASFNKQTALLNSDYAPAPTIESEDGEIENPDYTTAVATMATALAALVEATAEQWRYIAQRQARAEIADTTQLHLAVIGILPTMPLLTAYVEGEAIGSIDGRMTLDNARAKIIAELSPPEVEVQNV